MNIVFVNIEGKGTNICTISSTIIATQQKPDMCVIDNDKKLVTLLELSVPFEPNIDKAHNIKCERYSSLVADINHTTSWKCESICLEVGSRGLIIN